MKIKYIWLILILIGFTACEDNDNITTTQSLPALTAGSADFSNYVSIGNSLTAGYTDNALFIAGQVNSFPNIVAGKFALAGGGQFSQPLMNDNIGGMVAYGNVVLNPRLYLALPPVVDSPIPIYLNAIPTTDATQNIFGSSGPFNNMGIPGAQVGHLLFDGYAALNPYFGRMASAPNATVMGDALTQNPSFFSLWIGNNDVLGYATSGGDGSSPITDIGAFTGAYNGIVSSLTANGAKGIIANIPDVTTIPFFTTVPHNPLDPNDEDTGPDLVAQIPTLNTIYGALNGIFSAYGETNRIITFSDQESNAVVIKDESLTNFSAQITGGLLLNLPAFEAFIAQFGLPPAVAPDVAGLLGYVYGQARQATENDLIVLTSSTVIGTVNTDNVDFLMSQGLSQTLAGQFSVEGISLPLADKWVLLPNEQADVATATQAFNSVIEAAANSAGIAHVDAYSILTEIATTGVQSNNFILTSDLVLGGTFSLDGVHLTARGNALVANELLNAIDTAYGSNFKASGNLVDIGDYPTNYPPSLQ